MSLVSLLSVAEKYVGFKIDTIRQSVCPTNHERLVSRETVESPRKGSETLWYQTIINNLVLNLVINLVLNNIRSDKGLTLETSASQFTVEISPLSRT